MGWPVLPVHSFIDGCCTCGDKNCRSPGKHPLTASGVKDASTDNAVIRRWLEETENKANIGIATGNGLLVLDVDAKSGGLVSLAAWEDRFGKLPLTPTVETGGGGRHFYFCHPNDLTIGNKTGIAPGIDIRGTGGYVVAPPSTHSTGNPYRWKTPENTPVSPVPPWLLGMLVTPPIRGSISPDASAGPVLRVRLPACDLADAPGVGEGQRHGRLCQLAGIHLARGENVEAVEALALVWAARCEPPLGEDEVRKTVNSLAKKHAGALILVAESNDIDAIPLPQAAPWPVLHENALHGFVGETVNLIAPQTEADPVAILASSLGCAGNCIGRKVWFPVEGDRHHANLFLCLVGDSSKGRKGTSLGRTLTLWPADDPWRMNCIVNGLSSGEGLKWAVRDKVEVTEPVKEKGKVVGYQPVIKDHGVVDKRLLVVEPEFVQTLKVAQRDGNTVSAVMRQAYDTGTLRTLTRNDPTVATDAHISILAHITRQELTKELSDTDCSNGFANRFLWFAVKRSKLLPDGGIDVDLTPLQARLRQVLAHTTGCMSRSPAARQLWHELYPLLTADRPGLWGKVTSRGEAQTLRLSMVYAVLDGTTIIDVPHLRAAFAVWQYAEASARLIFTDEEAMDPLEKSLLDKITASPGINRKKLHKALGGHIQADEMVTALGKLASQGKVRSEMVATGGRPSECWWPVDSPSPLPVSLVPTPTPGTDDATKRTKPVETASERESSFARSEVAAPVAIPDSQGEVADASPLSLVDLFAKVREIGSKIVRSPDGTFMVQDVANGMLAPQLLAALVTHRDELALLVPSAAPTVEQKPMTAEERRHAEWLKEYEAAQAERMAREAELRKEEVSEEEWTRLLTEM
jgi:hypothetical protein